MKHWGQMKLEKRHTKSFRGVNNPELMKLVEDTEKSLPLYLTGLYDLKNHWNTMFFVAQKNNHNNIWVLDVDTNKPVQIPKYRKHPQPEKDEGASGE
nr:MAG TPA: hypothetical protein [Caudoviricetes sp.]